MTTRILIGDCRDVLRTLDDESVQCVVTSPPYWGLRDYGIPPLIWGGEPTCEHEWGDQIRKTGGAGFQGKNSLRLGRQNVDAQEKVRDAGNVCVECGAWRGCLGLDPDYQMFVGHMIEVFREVYRVLRNDGTLWLNLGDSYATGAGRVGERPGGGARGDRWVGAMGKHGYVGNSVPVGPMSQPNRMPQQGLKPKDMVGAPWRVALALQADGWWLRQDIIWHKPNPMPESVTDRCTKAHEYLFLLSKSETYFFDQDAIKEKASANTNARLPNNGYKTPDGWDTRTGSGGHGSFHKEGREAGQTGYDHKRKTAEVGSGIKNNTSMDAALAVMPPERIKRSVWTVATEPFPQAHFATFPPALIVPCILAGCPEFTCGNCGTALDSRYGKGKSNTTGKTLAHMQMVRGEGNAGPAQSRQEFLQQGMCVEVYGQEPPHHEGQDDQFAGLCSDPQAGTSERDQRRLRDGASSRDGGAAGTPPSADGGRPPSRQQQAEQHPEEPGDADEDCARQASEAADGDDPLSALRDEGDNFSACPNCSAALSEVGIKPGQVLDCFGGAGTTGLVAERLKRNAILVELNPDFAAMAKARIAGDCPMFTEVA